MNKKIKIIDLFNKKANNEKMPKKFKYKNYIFELDDVNEYTIDKEKQVAFTELIQFNLNNLNDEVEILEDNTEEIEELKYTLNECYYTEKDREYFKNTNNTINKLIKAINSIRKDKNND